MKMTKHLEMFMRTSEEYFNGDSKAKTEVLLVEDCEMANEVITELVNDFFGYDVKLTIATTVEEAMTAIGSGKTFDVVFLDGNLPDGKTVGLIKEMSERALRIVSTSNCTEMQKVHLKEGAHVAIEKHKVPRYLKEILERI